MRKYFEVVVLILSVFGFNSLAMESASDTLTDTQCYRFAKNFKSSSAGNLQTLSQCLHLALTKSSTIKHMAARSASKKYQAIGYMNMIFVLNTNTEHQIADKFKSKKIRVIAGEMTGLENIESIAVSPDGDTIAVINRTSGNNVNNSSLLLFPSNKNGNISPKHVNTHIDLVDATKITYDFNGRNILVSLPHSKEIISFNAVADSRSPLQTKLPDKLVLIDSSYKLNQLIDIKYIDKDSLLVIDKTQGLKLFRIKNQKVKLVWSLERESISISTLENIEISVVDKHLSLSSKNGEQFSVNLP